jgi:DNA-binding MurR/RpiR family transcriptional regulator
MSGVADRIMLHAQRLTATERRVAEVIAEEPQTIAFGTVAQVAKRAGTSGPSVVRLAVKLGYAGFVELQADVQRDVARQLGPARERIRQTPPSDVLGQVSAQEQHNVAQTLGTIPSEVFESVVTRLANPSRAVWVLSGDVTTPVGISLAVPLGQLRDRVTLLAASEVAASRMLGGLRAGDLLVAIDIRRYERWLVKVTRWVMGEGAELIALTDSPLSPLVSGATDTLLLCATGVGPFDSMVGGLALANALVAGVAALMRHSAAPRLDTIETAWSSSAALVAEAPGARSDRLDATPAPLRDGRERSGPTLGSADRRAAGSTPAEVLSGWPAG